MTERIVALVRHAAPGIVIDVPPSNWNLSPEGAESCTQLAEDLRGLLPATLVSSTEPKAVQTADRIGQQLGLDVSSRDGLREHRRPGEYMSTNDFHSRIRAFFESPTTVVYGQESCDELGLRIEAEVRRALSRDPNSNVILVTHGTAMTSFIMLHWHVDPFDLWKSLGLPAYLAFTVPTFDIVGARGLDTTLFAKTSPEPGP